MDDRPFLRWFLALTVAVLLTEGAIRIMERIVGMRLTPTPCHRGRYSRCMAWSRVTHHMHQPTCSYVAPPRPEDGIPSIPVRYNAMGIRGPEISASDQTRILLLGDSFLEADEILFEETLGERLARQLPHLQVIQHGVSSWSPLTEWAWFISEGQFLRPERLYLFVGMNDFLSTYQWSDIAYRKLYRFQDGLPHDIPSIRGEGLSPPAWMFRSRLLTLASVPFGRAQLARSFVEPSQVAEREAMLRPGRPQRLQAP